MRETSLLLLIVEGGEFKQPDMSFIYCDMAEFTQLELNLTKFMESEQE